MSRVTLLCCALFVSTAFAQPRSAESPLTTNLRGPDVVHKGDVINVQLDLMRSPQFAGPLIVHLAVPQGAQLVVGTIDETITDGSMVQTRVYRLRISEVPKGDLIVTVDLRSEHYGALATAVYRFGRPEPKRPQPIAPPANLRLRGELPDQRSSQGVPSRSPR